MPKADNDAIPPMIFHNIAWMKWYRGSQDNDHSFGGHSYFLEGHAYGHECYTFAERDGWYYGYAPANGRTNVKKLGGSSTDSKVEGVVVIWFSRSPRLRQSYIVGWYEDATVYREAQTPTDLEANFLNGERIRFRAKARAARLVDEVDRRFVIPAAKQEPGGYGQHANWYGNPEFNKRVWQYILEEKRNAGTDPGSPLRNRDYLQRKEIEETAVRLAWAYYESARGGRRKIKDVQKDNKGWDLECRNEQGDLLVEVKGMGGVVLTAELTPNEYKMMREKKAEWALFAVTGCLTNEPREHAFHFNSSTGSWVDVLSNRELQIVEKTGAVVTD